MPYLLDQGVIDRARIQSPAFKKATNEVFDRHVGTGSEYSNMVQANHVSSRPRIRAIVDNSGVKLAISVSGLTAARTQVLRLAQALNINQLLAVLSPNNEWLDKRLPLMTICIQSVRRAVSFDKLVNNLHTLRDEKLLPDNLKALTGVLHR